MKFVNYIIIVILGNIFLLSNARVLIEQYYSLKRLIIFKKQQLSFKVNRLITFLTFFALGIVVYCYKFSELAVLIICLNYYLFLPKISLKKYPLTRRSVVMCLLSSLIYISMVLLGISFKVEFLIACLNLLIASASLVIGYFITYPLEKIIQGHYIKKARNKIIKNRYICIGITGSYGKTTLKNFIYQILKTHYRISDQNHNFNTMMGLCKYINNVVKDDDQILIVELGIDKLNSMIKFKKLLHLDYAFITNIGPMHLSTFKSVDNIAKEKAIIMELLKKDGKLFINDNIEEKYRQYIKYSYVVFSKKNLQIKDEFFYQVKYNGQNIKTKILSENNLNYIDAAIEIGKLLSLNDIEIEKGIRNLNLPSRRGQLLIKDKMMFYDDSYNANYLQMIDNIKRINNTTYYKIIITGGLIELGDKYEEYNRKIGELLLLFDEVYLINNDKNHPLKLAYESKKKHGLIILNSVTAALKQIKPQEDEMFIYIAAKGSDYYLK